MNRPKKGYIKKIDFFNGLQKGKMLALFPDVLKQEQTTYNIDTLGLISRL